MFFSTSLASIKTLIYNDFDTMPGSPLILSGVV